MIDIFQYTNSITQKKELKDLSDIFKTNEGLIWIDLENPSTNEMEMFLTSKFNLPEAVIYRIKKGSELVTPAPSLEVFTDFLFLNFNSIDLKDYHQEKKDATKFEYRTSQISFLVFQKVLISIHYKPMVGLDYFKNECLTKQNILGLGANHLVYLFTTKIVDNYLPCIARMDLLIEEFEDKIYHDQQKDSMETVLHFKSDVVRLRRIGYYEKEIMYRLSHSEIDSINEADKTYFLKVEAHLNRLTVMLDSYRDALSGLIDAHMSLSSQNMNEVMKMLTIMSTIFLPLSVITGFYGMNLNFLPWASEHNSYIPVTLFMAMVAGMMLFVFKRKKWL